MLFNDDGDDEELLLFLLLLVLDVVDCFLAAFDLLDEALADVDDLGCFAVDVFVIFVDFDVDEEI